MAQRIHVPQFDTYVDFPDEMSQEDIASKINEHFYTPDPVTGQFMPKAVPETVPYPEGKSIEEVGASVGGFFTDIAKSLQTSAQQLEPQIPMDMAPPPTWDMQKEANFQQWYAGWAQETGLNPNPDDPGHAYNYRRAFDAGATPMPNEAGEYHWPSEFKTEGHPNLVVNGINTVTGQPVEPEATPKSKPSALATAGKRMAQSAAQGAGYGLLGLASEIENAPITESDFDTLTPMQKASIGDVLKERGIVSKTPAEFRTHALEILKEHRSNVADQLVAGQKALPELQQEPGFKGGVLGWLEEAAVAMAEFAAPMGITAISGPGGFAATYFVMKGQKYDQYMKQGYSKEISNRAANLSAILQSPLEYTGNVLQIGFLKKLFGETGTKLGMDAVMKSYLKTLVASAATEGIVEELPQDMLDVVADVYAENPTADPKIMANRVIQIWKSPEFQAETAKAVGLAATGGALLAGGGAAVNLPFAVRYLHKARGEAQEYVQGLRQMSKPIPTARLEEIRKGFEESAPGHPIVEELGAYIKERQEAEQPKAKAPAEEAPAPQAAAEPTAATKGPYAEFVGWQETGIPEKPPIALYNVFGGPLDKSTVSSETLTQEGIEIPKTPEYKAEPAVPAEEQFAQAKEAEKPRREKYAEAGIPTAEQEITGIPTEGITKETEIPQMVAPEFTTLAEAATWGKTATDEQITALAEIKKDHMTAVEFYRSLKNFPEAAQELRRAQLIQRALDAAEQPERFRLEAAPKFAKEVTAAERRFKSPTRHYQYIKEGVQQELQKLGIPGQRVQVFWDTSEVPGLHKALIERYGSKAAALQVRGQTSPTTGDVRVFARNFSDVKDAFGTVMHELFAHQGIRALTKDSEKLNKLLLQVFASKRHDPAMRKLMESNYGKQHPVESEAWKQLLADEWLAFKVKEGAPKEKGLRVWIDKIVSAVREYLRSKGVNLTFSDTEIRNLLTSALGAVREAAPEYIAERTAPSFELKPTEPTPEEKTAIAEIEAFHGSPHKFDTFSMEKVGTGEGAQAFGYGLYFTSEKNVAKHYANLGKVDITIEDQVIQNLNQRVTEKLDAISRKIESNPNAPFDAKLDKEMWDLYHLKQRFDPSKTTEKAQFPIFLRDQYGDDLSKALAKFGKDYNIKTDDLMQIIDNRNLYSVTLHKGKQPGEYDYLKWDEPISEQNISIRNKLEKAGIMEKAGFTLSPHVSNNFGESLYKRLSNALGSDREASAFLLRAGIDGIEYPAGSLSGKAGTARNYVVFDENAITIEPSEVGEIRLEAAPEQKSFLRKVVSTAKSYDEASETSGPYTNLLIKDKGKSDTLMVQFSNGVTKTEDLGEEYYNDLYSKREGYVRPADFWEVPEWMATIAHNIPSVDALVVRDMDSAIKAADKYKTVMFSALDVNKDLIKEFAQKFPGRVIVGGYIPKEFFAGTKVEFFDNVKDAMTATGHEYSEGTDFRHFQNTETIPRLCMSSGCAHKCAFCTVPKKIQAATLEDITRQVESFKPLQFTWVYLNDKTFGQAKNHTAIVDLNKKLQQQNPGFKGFIIQTTAPQFLKFSDEFLRDSGIKFVELGMESYNDEILAKINKPHREKQLDAAVEKMRQNNIVFIPNVLVGLAGKDKSGKAWSETAETYQHTLDWLESNADIISHINIYNLALYQGTELANQLEPMAEVDVNENVVRKSYMEDPELHERFYKRFIQFGQDQLDAVPAGLTAETVKGGTPVNEPTRAALTKAGISIGYGPHRKTFLVSQGVEAGTLYGPPPKGSVTRQRIIIRPLTGRETITEHFVTIGDREYKVIPGPIWPKTKSLRQDAIDAAVQEYAHEQEWYAEWRRSMERFQDKGVSPEHIDQYFRLHTILSAAWSPAVAANKTGEVMKVLEDKGFIKRGDVAGITPDAIKKINQIWKGKDRHLTSLEDYTQAYGAKIGAMMFAVQYPETHESAVVIDRHMGRPWGYNVLWSESKAKASMFSVRKGVQREITNDVVEAANRLNIPVPAVQAALWYKAGAGHAGDVTHFEDAIRLNPKRALGYTAFRATTVEPVKIIHFGKHLYANVHGARRPEPLTKAEKAQLADYRQRGLFDKPLSEKDEEAIQALTSKAEGDKPHLWSRSDVIARMSAHTVDNPYMPMAYWYPAGERRESWFFGKESMLSTVYEDEIYDGLTDTLNYWQQAQKRASNDPKVKSGQLSVSNILVNTFANLIYQTSSYKGFKASIGDKPVILTFEDFPVEEFGYEAHVLLAGAVEGMQDLPQDLETLSPVTNRLSCNLEQHVRQGFLSYPVDILDVSPQIGQAGELTDGKREYGLSLTIKGPRTAIEAALSDVVGLQLKQKSVLVLSTGEYEPNGTLLTFDVNTRDLKAIDAALSRSGLDTYTLLSTAKGPKVQLFVPSSAHDNAEAIQNLESLYTSIGVPGSMTHSDVHAALIGENRVETPEQNYLDNINRFHQSKGGEVYANAKLQGDKYAAAARLALDEVLATEGKLPRPEPQDSSLSLREPKATEDEYAALHTIMAEEAFQKWFEGSKIRNEDGTPKILYHGTRYKFADFQKGDIGYHFGTAQQANQRLSGDVPSNYWDYPISDLSVVPVVLNIKRPIRAKSDIPAWDSLDDLMFIALPDQVKTPEMYRIMEHYQVEFEEAIEPSRMLQIKEEAAKAIRAELERQGYDGIIYPNKYEAPEEGADSYIAFHPTQIKSVFNMGPWDPTNPNISLAMQRDVPVMTDSAKQKSAEIMSAVDSAFESVLGRYENLPGRIQAELVPQIDVTANMSSMQWQAILGPELFQTMLKEGVLAKTNIGVTQAAVMISTNLNTLKNIDRTAYHEAYHIVEKWVMSEKDLERMQKFEPSSEQRADAFARFAADQKLETQQPNWLRSIWYTLLNILRKLQNSLLGLGFTTQESIFSKVLLGRYTPLQADQVQARLDAIQRHYMRNFRDVTVQDFSAQTEKQAKDLVEQHKRVIEEYALGTPPSDDRWLTDIPEEVQLPELVHIYELLTNGKLPEVAKYFRSRRGTTLKGIFFPRTGGESFIKIQKDVFKDPHETVKILAHELGHLVDFLPNEVLAKTLLGKIANLKDHMRQTLPYRPGAPGELTEEDRRRLRLEAKHILDTGYTWIDEMIRKEMPVTPEQILNIWNNVAKSKENEDLYKFVASLPAESKKLIIKQALKGVVPNELKAFAKWVEQPTGKKILMPHNVSPEELRAKYAELIAEEIRKRRLWVESEIHDELYNWSKRWRPFDPAADPQYTAYRRTANELYADAISGLFVSPNMLHRLAPKFYESFFLWLENNPQFRTIYNDIQDSIRAGTTLSGLSDRTYKDFRESNESWYNALKREQEPFKDAFLRDVFDAYHYLLKDIRRYGESQIPAEDNPRYRIEDMLYTGSEIEAYLTNIKANVQSVLTKANLDWDREFGLLAFLERVIMERAEMANPRGWNVTRALEKLDALETKDLTPARWQAVNEALAGFRAVHEEFFIKKAEKAEVFSDALMKVMKSRKAYATFNVLNYLERNYGRTAAMHVYQQFGTLQKIANPATATVMQDLSMIKAINKNTAIRSAVKFYQEMYAPMFPDDTQAIRPADRRFNGRFQEIIPPKDPNLGLLVYLHKGKAYGYYVNRYVADAINRNPFEANIVTRILRGVANPFRKVFTGINYGFWIFNAFFRDFQRAMSNLPGYNVPSFAKTWAESLRPAFRSVFGIPDSVVTEMQKGNMLISIADYRGTVPEEQQIERLLKAYHLKPYEFQSKIMQPFGHLFNWVRNILWLGEHYFTGVGQSLERTTKIAGYKYLKAKFPDMPEEALAHAVRNIGSPDFLRRGAAHNLINNFLLFSNAMKEGYRGDYMAFKDRPAEFIIKKIGWAILPKILMYSAAIGLLGGGLKKIFDGVSEYDATNYHIIPVGLTKSGKAVYLRVPTDESSRLLGGVVWKSLNRRDLDWVQSFQQLSDYMAGQAPTLNPGIELISQTVQYASGHNSYDQFYGTYALDPLTFAAGGTRAHLKFLKHLLQRSGASIVYQFKSDDIEQIQEELETTMGFPIVTKVANWAIYLADKPVASNIIGRFLKVSNQGQREELQVGMKEIRSHQAEITLEAKEAVSKLVNGKPMTSRDLLALAMKPDLVERNEIVSLARKYGWIYLEEYMAARTTEEKFYVLSQLLKKAGVGPERIIPPDLLPSAQKEKLLKQQEK